MLFERVGKSTIFTSSKEMGLFIDNTTINGLVRKVTRGHAHKLGTWESRNATKTLTQASVERTSAPSLLIALFHYLEL